MDLTQTLDVKAWEHNVNQQALLTCSMVTHLKPLTKLESNMVNH